MLSISLSNKKIRKDLKNSYYEKSKTEIKKISFKTFLSLESVINEFEEFHLNKSYYNPTGIKGFSGNYDAIGSLIYDVYSEDKSSIVGKLNIEFFAHFGDAYNTLKIHLYGRPDSFNTDVVEKLAEKFHSFMEGGNKNG